MSDDWSKNYIDVHRERQQERQNQQRRADLARAGAPDFFQRIKERIKHDLQVFYGANVLQSLKLREESATKYIVFHSSPTVRLQVELDTLFIKYEYTFYEDNGEGKENLRRETGALRICSDLSGILRSRRNGTSLASESEVSKFFLQPMLDFIDGPVEEHGVETW